MITKGENEYELFENINTKNLPLKPSDRIKSLLLSKIDSSVKKHYNKEWYKITKDRDYKAIETFLVMYFIYKYKKIIKKCELYKNYKWLVENNDILDIFNDLQNFNEYYISIKNGTFNTKYDRLKKLIKTSFDTEYAILFYLCFLDFVKESSLTETESIDIFKIYESYLIRLHFIGTLNNVIELTLLYNIHTKCLNTIRRTNCSYIIALKNIMSEIMPSNDNFIFGIKNKNIGLNSRNETSKTKSIIFTRLENSFETEISINRCITTEHIMPRMLTDEWKIDLGADYDRIHQHYLHKLCNLTVTEKNSKLSNRRFIDKKDIYKESGYVFLSQSLLEYDKWDEESMKLREKKDY